MRAYIQQEWENWSKKIEAYARCADDLEALRICFFCGAIAVLCLVHDSVSFKTDMERGALLSDLFEEMATFAQNLNSEKARKLDPRVN